MGLMLEYLIKPRDQVDDWPLIIHRDEQASVFTPEGWACEQGYQSVALTSNIARAASHAFYEAIGYRSIATSRLLRKELAAC